MPVVEAYPDLQQSYLQHIATPMDFRTIEEERLWYYRSITELQHDLILVFSNCMEFNDTDSPLYHTAKYVVLICIHDLNILAFASVVAFLICLFIFFLLNSFMIGQLEEKFRGVCEILGVRLRHH